MIKFRLIILGFASTIFIITGCDETQASNNKNVKELTPTSVQKEVQLRGDFKRSFEVYELASNDITYYVSDPKKLLMKDSKSVNQKGYYKYFETCVVGKISSIGKYGPLGKYQNQITVREICV
ncbi:hypothetical protein [Psychrobacter sp. ANT_H3]|uniref:hypothetical protein n=1 Tax=Psychrobacter sp. ANT_H3 TaxID=3019444 RepID=UPI0022F1D723|nr:hypothetical protein [Psychrobacter sp. ANT_H3]MDA5132450.1 hypothetical protein [Psychrobacter sp. ANT_H3]